MEGNNNAPFHKGQTIMAIADGYSLLRGQKIKVVSKGEHFTVIDLMFCCRWRVDIGQKSVAGVVECPFCNSIGHDDTLWANAKLFAPIQHQYTDIAKELADSFKTTEEVPDKILIPEKVKPC